MKIRKVMVKSIALAVAGIFLSLALSISAWAAAPKPAYVYVYNNGEQIAALTMDAGSTASLTAIVFDKNNTVIENAKITWKSSKKKIASVSKTGGVTALTKGTTVITATCKNKKTKVTVTVADGEDPPVPTDEIISIKANFYHGAYLTDGGDVYSTAMFSTSGDDYIVHNKISGLSNISKIDCSPVGGIAVDKSGNLYTWTMDWNTMLANPASRVSGIDGVTDVAAGGDGGNFSPAPFYYVLKTDGSVWAWGDNSKYQLGDGTTIDRSVPAPIDALGLGNSAISAGATQGIALKGGSVYYWGTIPTPNTSYPTPVMLDAVSSVTTIDAGGNYCLAKKSDGSVYFWGHGTPGYVPDLVNPVAMTAGQELYFNPMFIKSDGSLWQTSMSMATGDLMPLEKIPGFDNYDLKLLDAFDDSYFITKDGKLLIQVSTQTVPYVELNPLQ